MGSEAAAPIRWASPAPGFGHQAGKQPVPPLRLWWAAALCSSWIELRGQGPAVRAGLARIGGEQVIVVAMDRYAAERDGIAAGIAATLASRC